MISEHRSLQIGIPAAGLFFCAVMPPEGAPRYWICPFLALTGLPCPLCGMTRAMILLGHGRWREALVYHAFSPLAMAALLGWLGVALFRPAWRPRLPAPAAWTLAAAAGIFGALRWWGIIESPPQ